MPSTEVTQDEKSYLHSHYRPVAKCKCRECNTFAMVRMAIFKTGNGKSGNRGIRESGNPGIGESGNRGIRESGNNQFLDILRYKASDKNIFRKGV